MVFRIRGITRWEKIWGSIVKETLGARLYEDPKESLEVEKCGLLDTEQLARPWDYLEWDTSVDE
jgi:hypothetical protein